VTGAARSTTRWLIVNADDLGQSDGVNDGIMTAVERGVVTSASLMVRWPAAADAAAWARGRDDVSIGLHLDLGEWIVRDGSWEPVYEVVDAHDGPAVAGELDRQLRRFEQLMGRAPSHIDSHQHTHLHEPVRSSVLAAASRFRVPVRSLGDITYCGEFYGQWGGGEPHPECITYDALVSIVDALGPGCTELACHPGADALADIDSMYLAERARERRVLCDPRLPDALAARDVRLRSFARDPVGNR
jgi:chitin disaccharide deacetylase